MRTGRVIVLALAAAAAAACGAIRHARVLSPRPAVAPSAQRSAPAPAYRWLVPTHGSPPSIAAENREPGTGSWRLPGPAADVGGLAYGPIRGYVSAQALAPGQVERVYVSDPGAHVARIAVFRMGWYAGRGGREVLVSGRLALVPQPACAHSFLTGLTECRWHPTLSFPIPPALPTGVYITKLSARGGESDCLFVVTANRAAPLLAQLPTATYEAYNAWGGDSLYPGGTDLVRVTGATQGVEVSYDRPYDSVTGAGEFFARDVAMVRFLERYGYPVAYTTSESVDRDPGQLLGARAVIDFGHSEYWSQRQADGFAAARDRGVSLLFLGSDTLAWRVRYAPASARSSQAGAPDQVIVAYKEHAQLDPDRSHPTGPFPGGGAPLAGSAYVGCITPRLRVAGSPQYRYYSWQPAARLWPSWLFARAGIGPLTRIPGIVGYELDVRTGQSPPGTALIGFGHATCMHAAAGEPQPGRNQNLAETTLYRARSGAIVFDSGTLGWELGLEPVPSASPDAPRAPDPRVVRMTRNLLGFVLGPRPLRA